MDLFFGGLLLGVVIGAGVVTAALAAAKPRLPW